jgi:ABC-type branched-subunit amino acid transport system substrate-binding protein
MPTCVESSATAAFNLLIRRGALALVGPTLLPQAFAADPIAERRGVPVVAPLSLNVALRRQPGLQRVVVF